MNRIRHDKDEAKRRIAHYLWRRYLKNCDDYTFKAKQIAREVPYNSTYVAMVLKDWMPSPITLLHIRSHHKVYKTQFEKTGVRNKIRKLVN